MKNIICNCCVGARLYEVTKQQFPNPFMWAFISDDDFVYLMNNYNDINLDNIAVKLEHYKNHKENTVNIIVDDKINLHYIHYVEDMQYDVPTKKYNTNIYYKDIIQYAIDKYKIRLNRSTEDPIFLFSFNSVNLDYPNYYTTLNKLLNTNKKLIILAHDNAVIPENIKANITIIKCNRDVMQLNGTGLALAIKEKIFN